MTGRSPISIYTSNVCRYTVQVHFECNRMHNINANCNCLYTSLSACERNVSDVSSYYTRVMR